MPTALSRTILPVLGIFALVLAAGDACAATITVQVLDLAGMPQTRAVNVRVVDTESGIELVPRRSVSTAGDTVLVLNRDPLTAARSSLRLEFTAAVSGELKSATLDRVFNVDQSVIVTMPVGPDDCPTPAPVYAVCTPYSRPHRFFRLFCRQ